MLLTSRHSSLLTRKMKIESSPSTAHGSQFLVLWKVQNKMKENANARVKCKNLNSWKIQLRNGLYFQIFLFITFIKLSLKYICPLNKYIIMTILSICNLEVNQGHLTCSHLLFQNKILEKYLISGFSVRVYMLDNKVVFFSWNDTELNSCFPQANIIIKEHLHIWLLRKRSGKLRIQS